MKVCVTGTRHGMTERQKASFHGLILDLGPTEFRHGSCSGVDDEAAQQAYQIIPRPRIIAHPGPDGEWKAKFDHNDEVLPEKNHFARNRDLVDLTDVCIACPGTPEWSDRGGTVYTYNYAVKKGKKTYIIWPNGVVEE